MDWLNANGLEDGDIPAGAGCPFFNHCGVRNNNCPHESQSNLREKPFSCAVARSFSLVGSKNQEVS